MFGYRYKITIVCQFGGHTAATQDQGLGGGSRETSQNNLDQAPRQPVHKTHFITIISKSLKVEIEPKSCGKLQWLELYNIL